MSRGKKLLEMALAYNKEASTSTQNSEQLSLSDDNTEKKNQYDFGSGSSDLCQPSEISSSELCADENGNSETAIPTDVAGAPLKEPVAKNRSKKANKRGLEQKYCKKKLRLSGRAYTNRIGKDIPEKIPRLVHCSNCRFHCNEKFSQMKRFYLCKGPSGRKT